MPGVTSDRSAILVAGLLAAGLACGAGVVVLAHGERPAMAGRQRAFADIALVDQDGVERSLRFWSGRLVVLDFIFTSCGDTCPIKTSQLADVQQSLDPALRDRVQFVSVSIDPEHDTIDALKAYASRNGAELSNWSFLTGNLTKIAQLAAVFEPGQGSGGDIASYITTLHMTGGGAHIMQRYSGEPVDQALLRRDIAAQATDQSWQQAAGHPLP